MLVGSKELHIKHRCPRCLSNIVSNSCTDELVGKDATLLSQAAMALIIGLSQQTKLDRWDPVSGQINSAIACSRCAGAFCLSHFRPWQWPQTSFLSALAESLAVCRVILSFYLNLSLFFSFQCQFFYSSHCQGSEGHLKFTRRKFRSAKINLKFRERRKTWTQSDTTFSSDRWYKRNRLVFQEQLHYMGKRMWTLSHHSHAYVHRSCILSNWKHTIVSVCSITVSLHWN